MVCFSNVYAQDAFRFLGTSNSLWSIAGNWENGQKPIDATALVHLLSSVVVDENVEVQDLIYDESEVSVTVAPGNRLTVNRMMSPVAAQYLIVEDSAQLVYGQTTAITVRKKISPFYNAKESAAWHFIASPLMETLLPTDLDSLVYEAANFELMRFNQSNVGHEWERYKDEAYQDSFTLNNGQGYLYANGSEVTVSFVGSMLPSDSEQSFPLEYNDATNVVAKGFNLVGNPFTCNAYCDRSYYRMNAGGTDVELVRASADEPISPCTGVLVQATEAGQSVGFSRNPMAIEDKGCLRLTLKSNGSVMDEMLLSFNAGDEIGKFNFTEHTTQMYVMQDGQACAIATTETTSQIPLHFKTISNGTFTLTVVPENADLRSLWLFDNVSGADVDLLAMPTYTFSATPTDYSSRFKLFVNTDHGIGEEVGEKPFAYFSNGNIVISDMEATGTLQIIDITGRVVMETPFEGRTTIPFTASAGVYVLRLAMSREVWCQKVVL